MKYYIPLFKQERSQLQGFSAREMRPGPKLRAAEGKVQQEARALARTVR